MPGWTTTKSRDINMADVPNPYLDFDLIEDEIEKELVSRSETPEADPISFDTIAVKLLKDNFILTALELHTELVESGRDLPRLRDFFSNPAHFERSKNESGLGPCSPGLRAYSFCPLSSVASFRTSNATNISPQVMFTFRGCV